MSLPTLLVMPDDEFGRGAFAFDHSNEHWRFLAAQTTANPFQPPAQVFDPQQNIGAWHEDHYEGHANMTIRLPVFWGWWLIGEKDYGFTGSPNLMDTNLDDPGQLAWWTFANHSDHMIASTLLPLTFNLFYPTLGFRGGPPPA
jgi:hypothetical protein